MWKPGFNLIYVWTAGVEIGRPNVIHFGRSHKFWQPQVISVGPKVVETTKVNIV